MLGISKFSVRKKKNTHQRCCRPLNSPGGVAVLLGNKKSGDLQNDVFCNLTPLSLDLSLFLWVSSKALGIHKICLG